jgi:hypothetical protein
MRTRARKLYLLHLLNSVEILHRPVKDRHQYLSCLHPGVLKGWRREGLVPWHKYEVCNEHESSQASLTFLSRNVVDGR